MHLRVPRPRRRLSVPLLLAAATALAACGHTATTPAAGTSSAPSSPRPSASSTLPAVHTVAGMPPVVDPANIYSQQRAGMLQPFLRGLPERVYVPNSGGHGVDVIDPATFRVIAHFETGLAPQHVVPAYNLKALWVNNNGANSLTEIDPNTEQPVKTVPVPDPYNMYYTPNGQYAIVMAESLQRMEFLNAATMTPAFTLQTSCDGLNHMDFTAGGHYAVASCEFGNRIIRVNMVTHKQVGSLVLGNGHSMPQDVRLSADGKTFYVADMVNAGVWRINAKTFALEGFVHTGTGAHGLYPSRNGKDLYVTNRGSAKVYAPPNGPGSISVIDFATHAVIHTWPIPGGGSPDMGNLTPDGRELWLSGRYDNVVYCIDTTNGHLLAKIPVGVAPHGLTVWPQPGRYSLGHTGNMR